MRGWRRGYCNCLRKPWPLNFHWGPVVCTMWPVLVLRGVYRPRSTCGWCIFFEACLSTAAAVLNTHMCVARGCDRGLQKALCIL